MERIAKEERIDVGRCKNVKAKEEKEKEGEGKMSVIDYERRKCGRKKRRSEV